MSGEAELFSTFYVLAYISTGRAGSSTMPHQQTLVLPRVYGSVLLKFQVRELIIKPCVRLDGTQELVA
jgi:hypothetical protein